MTAGTLDEVVDRIIISNDPDKIGKLRADLEYLKNNGLIDRSEADELIKRIDKKKKYDYYIAMIKAALDKMFIPINDHRPKPILKDEKRKAPKSVLFQILNLVNEKLNMLQRTRAVYRGDAESHHSSSSDSSSPSEDEKHNESEKTKPSTGAKTTTGTGRLSRGERPNQQPSEEQKSLGSSEILTSKKMQRSTRNENMTEFLNFLERTNIENKMENYKNIGDEEEIRKYIQTVLADAIHFNYSFREFKTTFNNYADFIIDEKVSGRGVLSKKMTLKKLFKEELGKAEKKYKMDQKKKK